MSETSSSSRCGIDSGGTVSSLPCTCSLLECTEGREVGLLGRAPLANDLSRADDLDVARNNGTTNVFPGVLLELAELFVSRDGFHKRETLSVML